MHSSSDDDLWEYDAAVAGEFEQRHGTDSLALEWRESSAPKFKSSELAFGNRVTPLKPEFGDQSFSHEVENTGGSHDRFGPFLGGGDNSPFPHPSFLASEDEDAGLPVYAPALESLGYDAQSMDRKYAEVVHRYADDGDKMIECFAEICSERLKVAESKLKKAARLNQQEVARLRSVQDTTRGERNSWMLISLMRRAERARCEYFEGCRYRADEDLGLSERQIVEQYIMEDPEINQINVLVRWLEEVARSDDVPVFVADASWKSTADQISRSNSGSRDGLMISQGRRSGKEKALETSDEAEAELGEPTGVVSALDPDAPVRQHKRLHPDDEDVESRVLRGVWDLLRAGQRSEAAQLCRDCKQYWRASTLDALVLHDTQLSGETRSRAQEWCLDPSTPSDDTLSGNPFRATFKHACYQMACDKDNGFSLAERAVYGTLCGHLPAMLTMCQTWADHLWARLRCVRDCNLDDVLVRHPSRHRLAEDGLPGAPFPVPRQDVTLADIFRELSTSEAPEVRFGAENTFHDVQTHVALRNMAGLLLKLKEWVCHDAPDVEAARDAELARRRAQDGLAVFSLSPCRKGPSARSSRRFAPLVRFSAHLALVCDALDTSSIPPPLGTDWLPREAVDARHAVVDSYVQQLIERDLPMELVALYSSFLPDTVIMGENVRVRRVAEYLATIQDTGKKERFLQVARGVGLDVPRITKYVVESVTGSAGHKGDAPAAPTTQAPPTPFMLLSDPDSSSSVALGRGVAEEDKEKIRAIEWLTLDRCSTQSVEALVQSNALARHFLLEGKVECATELHEALPKGEAHPLLQARSLLVAQEEARAGRAGSDALDVRELEVEARTIQNATLEHVGHADLLDALNKHSDWFHLYSNKPELPVRPTSRAPSQKILYETAREKYEQDTLAWNQNHEDLARHAADSLLKILACGWMQDRDLEEEDAFSRTPMRKVELRSLRERYIPRLFVLAHHVLSSTGRLQDSVHLAELVAEERTQLYKCFLREDLQKLLELICGSCIGLMEEKASEDPLEFF